MTASEIQNLISGVSCYACLGLTFNQLLYLAALQQWLLALNPSADTSADHLLSVANCFRCYGGSMADLLELALLYEISTV